MPKLKFTASETFQTYEEFSDGAICDVSDARAEYLLATFPDFFSKVGESKSTPAPSANRAEKEPTKNR